jgi:sterol desaturase/sphingolipid hydroxylase (fatty acid hydroxylase superfamily)
MHHQFGKTNFSLYLTFWDKILGTEHPDYASRFQEIVANKRIAPKR